MRIIATLTAALLVIGTLSTQPFQTENNHATPEMMKAYKTAQNNA